MCVRACVSACVRACVCVCDVERRKLKNPKLFGALKKPDFRDKNLTLNTKRKVYQACVLSILLYGTECWIL